jgi:hypothetical protein
MACSIAVPQTAGEQRMPGNARKRIKDRRRDPVGDDDIYAPNRGGPGAVCAIYMEFLYPAPLSTLESIRGIRDIRIGLEHFQAK